MPATYRSLDAFYRSPLRRASRERDFGLRWVAADGTTYRAAWVEATGELYAVSHIRPDGRGGAVEILGRLPAACIQAALHGWRAACGAPRSFEWLRGRARSADARRRAGERRPLIPAVATRERSTLP